MGEKDWVLRVGAEGASDWGFIGFGFSWVFSRGFRASFWGFLRGLGFRV